MSEPQYDVCWRGDSWRDVPQPVIGTLSVKPLSAPTRPGSPNLRQRMCAENRLKVRAAFTDTYQSAVEIAQRVGITVQAVRHHLAEAMADGLCDVKVYRATKQWGRAERRYRRRQVQGQAA